MEGVYESRRRLGANEAEGSVMMVRERNGEKTKNVSVCGAVV